MSNKKKLLSVLSLTLIFSTTVSNVDGNIPKIALTSRFLQIIDGAFFTGEIVGITLQVRKKLLEMLEGKRQPDGIHEGLYVFEGTHHCINSLAILEANLQANQNELETQLHNIKIGQEKQTVSSKLEIVEKQLEKLIEPLENAKNDFQNTTISFISRVRTVKEPLIMLINEFCEKANRLDSLLLDWAKLNDDEETESFNKQVATFNTFYRFCGDLANFLEALIRGCPKAQQQFKKIMIERSKKTA